MNRFARLIVASQNCAVTCECCLEYVISSGDLETSLRLRECIDVCLLCGKTLARESPFSIEIGQLCARVCDWCAERCRQFSNSHLARCAEVCLECVREWQQIANTREEITV